MQFKKFTVGEIPYGIDGTDFKEQMIKRRPTFKEDKITNVNFDDEMFFQHLMDPHHHNNKVIKNFLDCLALCHTILIDEKDGVTSFNASSPDELALVNAAKYLGVTFIDKDDNDNIII